MIDCPVPCMRACMFVWRPPPGVGHNAAGVRAVAGSHSGLPGSYPPPRPHPLPRGSGCNHWPRPDDIHGHIWGEPDGCYKAKVMVLFEHICHVDWLFVDFTKGKILIRTKYTFLIVIELCCRFDHVGLGFVLSGLLFIQEVQNMVSQDWTVERVSLFWTFQILV